MHPNSVPPQSQLPHIPHPSTTGAQFSPSSLLPACPRQKARIVCFPNSGPVLWSPTRKEGGAPTLPHIKVPSQRTWGKKIGKALPTYPPAVQAYRAQGM